MEPDPLIGRIVSSRFQIAAFVREGGMASIYCGVQDEEPRHVALKIMNATLAQDPTFVRRFQREAKAAARIRCPNAVDILGFGQDEELVYIAMELLVGHDLLVPLNRDGRLSEQRSANIIRQMCEALSVAHAQNVIHRDLKPENVMLVRDPDDPTAERVKVLDFGIAKILDEQENEQDFAPKSGEGVTSVRSALTRVGMIVGTPAYMSPEQGRAEPVDARTDIYSCGVLLYELLTGNPPFAGETPLQVVMRHVNDVVTPPSVYIPIHPALESIVLKCLAKFPSDRQQSAQALSQELEQIMPELSTMPRVRAVPVAPPSSSVVVPLDANAATDDGDAQTHLRANLAADKNPPPSSDPTQRRDVGAPSPAGTLGPDSFPPLDDDDDAMTIRAEVEALPKGSVSATPPVRLTKRMLHEVTSTLKSPIGGKASNGVPVEEPTAPRSPKPSKAASPTDRIGVKRVAPNPAVGTVRMKPHKSTPATTPASAPAAATSVTPAASASAPPASTAAESTKEPALAPLPSWSPDAPSKTGTLGELVSRLQDSDDDKTKRLLVLAIAIGSAVLVMLMILLVAIIMLLSRDDPEPPPIPSTPAAPAPPANNY